MDRADMIKYAMYAAVAAAVVALVWWFTNRPKKDGFKTVDPPIEEVGIQPVENEAYSEEEEDYEEEDEDEEEDYEEEYEEPAKADDDYDDAASVDSD